jgi:hypothetical protein
MPYSQGLTNSPNPELNQPKFLVLTPNSLRTVLILFSNLCLSFPKYLFPIALPVKNLNVLLRPSILPTWLTNLNLLDLITLTL